METNLKLFQLFDQQGFRLFQFTNLGVAMVTVLSITEPALLKCFVLSCGTAQVVGGKGQKCTFCKSQSLISIANRLGVPTVPLLAIFRGMQKSI